MTTVTEPAIRWGVQRSFLDYVERMADGMVEAVDGATRSAADVRFPLIALQDHLDQERTVLVASRGALRCTGHRGMLAIAFEAPRIERIDGDLLVTIIDDDEPGNRLAIAELGEWRLVDGLLVAGRPTLTNDGAELFLGNYRTGMPLDPLEADLDEATRKRLFEEEQA